MRLPWDARFEEETRTYRFRGCCEDCAMFLPERGECAHRYPTWEHRRARFDALLEGCDVVFCKEFETA